MKRKGKRKRGFISCFIGGARLFHKWRLKGCFIFSSGVVCSIYDLLVCYLQMTPVFGESEAFPTGELKLKTSLNGAHW